MYEGGCEPFYNFLLCNMEVKNWILFLFWLSPLVHSQTIAHIKSLRDYLFTTNDYDSKIRPLTDQSLPIDVTITLVLKNVNELDEVEETLTTTGYLAVTWTDDQLTWDPKLYGSTNTLYWPQKEIWTPEIALKNSFGNFKKLGYDELNAKIYYLGYVSWYPHEVFVTTCTIDIRHFPFDEQVCELKFTSWSYNTGDMTFTHSSGLDTSRFQENPSWSLESTSYNFNADSYEPQINYIITLKRKASYTVVSVVLPVCLLAILNLFVFGLPASSGEKVGYAVTVFLALAVFLTIIESSMPKNSQTIPLFSLYMMLLVVQSTLITCIAIVLVKLFANDERGKGVPLVLVKFTEVMEFRCCKKDLSKDRVIDISKGNDEHLNDSEKKFEDIPDDNDQDVVTWTRVVAMLDRFFLIFFTITFVVLTIVFGILITS